MSLALCPECKLEKCLCPVIDSVCAQAQAADEVTREMAMGDPDRFSQFVMEDLGLTIEEVESIRKDGTAVDPDGILQWFVDTKRQLDDWHEWRQAFAERSVIDLDFQRRLTDYDREFLRRCLDWDSRLTKYDKRFLRGCGVKP